MIRVLEMYRRVVREFVTTELVGLIDWPRVIFEPAEQHQRVAKARGILPPELRGPNRRDDGRWRERVVAHLTDTISMEIRSPNDFPPMGQIAIHGPKEVAMSGPMDSGTQKEAGVRLRKYLTEELAYGR